MFNFLYEKYADFKTEGWMKVSPCRLLNSDKNYSSFLETRLLPDTESLDDSEAFVVLLPHQPFVPTAHGAPALVAMVT